MALTMTRTRTQTALTKLAQQVAIVHSELAFVEELLENTLDAWVTHVSRLKGGRQVTEDTLRGGLLLRRQTLIGIRTALYATIKQFDPELDPEQIGALDEWLKPYGLRSARVTRCRALLHYATAGSSAA